jgi:hypothetical protein
MVVNSETVDMWPDWFGGLAAALKARRDPILPEVFPTWTYIGTPVKNESIGETLRVGQWADE